MTAEPFDLWTIDELNRPVAHWSPYSLETHFLSAGWSDAPSHNSFVVRRQDETPPRQKSAPRRDFDSGAVVNALERVMNLPAISRLRMVVRYVAVRVKVIRVIAVAVSVTGRRMIVVSEHQPARALLRRFANRLFLRDDWLRWMTPFLVATSKALIAARTDSAASDGDSSIALRAAVTRFRT